ncbi:MAG: ATP-binding cassette domain-containing protein [Planctomycetota bacterium]
METGATILTLEAATAELHHPVVDLTVVSGDRLVLAGGTGDLHSAVLHLLAGAVRPAAGTVRYRGRDIWQEADQRVALARHVGFCFAGYGLINNMNVEENILLPLAYHNGRYDAAAAGRVVSHFGLEPIRRQRPALISEEERILAGLARAFVIDPEAVLFDCPEHLYTERIAGRLKAMLARSPAAFVAAGRYMALTGGAWRTIQLNSGTIVENKHAVEK